MGCESTQSRDETVIESTKTLDPARPASGGIVLLFATTLFLSSLLMFALEPIVARTVLPILGGTPMVWNTCVLFFQILLLGGYAYAHGVTTWLGSRRSSAAYGVVLLLPFVTLPFAIGPDAQPPADGNPIGWLLLVLAKSIGLPFFALAATAPILQRWFADTDHPSAKDPYFLYAASNLGSLLALVMYPRHHRADAPAADSEPAVDDWLRRVRSRGVPLGRRRLAAPGARRVAGSRRRALATTPVATALTWERRATWIALAFIPSSLMLAVTTYFSTDIAPVPLFWIAPLALYLLTFVVAFSARSASLAIDRRSAHAAPDSAARRADDRGGRHLAVDGDSAAPRGVHHGRPRLPRTARRRSAGADPLDGVLLLDRIRRHARRRVQYPGGTAPVQSRHRVPARARARAGRSPRAPAGDRVRPGR